MTWKNDTSKYDWPTVPLLLMTSGVRSCDKQALAILQRCNPTAAQKPAAVEGNTLSGRRHIRGVSELTIRQREYAELGVQAHNIPRLHRTNHHQPPREQKTNWPSLQWCSVSERCCAGGSSVRFSSNYACLLSPFAFLCTRPPPRREKMFVPTYTLLPGMF